MKLIINPITATAIVVRFSKDNLDSSNVEAFREQIKASTDNCDALLLDMSELNFVDSSGLGALLATLRVMNAKNGQLRLFGMTRPVRALFELVRMHRIFLIFNTEEEALADLSAGEQADK